MHLHALDGPWMDHPFWKTRFTIHDPADLAKLRTSGLAAVWIDVSKGLDAEVVPAPAPVPAPASVVVVAEAPAPAAAAPAPRTTLQEELKQAAHLKVGEQVNVDYVEALTLELQKGGGQAVSRTEEVVGGAAKPGERPAAAGARQIRIIADVVNVDAPNQRVTLRGPNRTVDLKVRDPQQLAMIAKGDQVEAVFTEAIAVAVEPAPKK